MPLSPIAPIDDNRDWGVASASRGAFSADGRRFGVIVSEPAPAPRLMVRDADTGRVIVELPIENPPWSAAWVLALSTDGALAAIGFTDGTLHLLGTRPPASRLLTIPARIGRGHERGVSCCALSPNGSRLVSGSHDRTLRIWDTASGTCQRLLIGHQAALTSVAFSHDGRKVLSASSDGALRLWDATSGKCLLVLQADGYAVQCCAISRDGSRLAAGMESGHVRLWNALDGRCLSNQPLHLAGVDQVAFSPDGTRVLSTGGDDTLRIADVRSGTPMLRASVRFWQGHDACAFTEDGAQVLSLRLGWRSRMCLIEWRDAQTGRCVRRMGQRSTAPGLVETPAEKTDWRQRWTRHHFPDTSPQRQRALTQVAFTPDGCHVLAGAKDGTLALWDATTGAFVRGFEGHLQGVVMFTLSRDAKRMVSTTGPTLRLWNVETGECLRLLEPVSSDINIVALSRDGTRLLARSNTYRPYRSSHPGPCLKAWNLDSAEWEFEMRHRKNITCLAESPDGTRVATGHVGGDVVVWDAHTGERLALMDGHLQDATCCAFSPDGLQVISGSKDCHLMAWDAVTGTHLWTADRQRGGVLSCAVSPDGAMVLSGGGNGTLKLWNARTGRCLRTVRAHVGGVTHCAWSPDGTRLLSNAARASVWDAATGALLMTIPAEA